MCSSLVLGAIVNPYIDMIAEKVQIPRNMWDEYALCVNFDKESKQLEMALKFLQNASWFLLLFRLLPSYPLFFKVGKSNAKLNSWLYCLKRNDNSCSIIWSKLQRMMAWRTSQLGRGEFGWSQSGGDSGTSAEQRSRINNYLNLLQGRRKHLNIIKNKVDQSKAK